MPVPDAQWLRRATQSAIVVPVPETDHLVTRHRRSVPAHVTVLYPFVPPQDIDARTVADLEAALIGIEAFDCAFSQVGWFGSEVVWLAPEPDAHFRALTRAVCERFPGHRPYDGRHPDTVPHLTVADHRTGDAHTRRRAAEDAAAVLPIHARIDRVRLVAGDDEHGPWRTVTEFALPAPADSPREAAADTFAV
ncbi:2'-5' RNA ligase family protein [Amycolatopsis granulosa]|uniref:2'-5' RNA ligase family protein n=1 Tax=Amycolatopsis granulosa TaxID=185684 RepID=UPI00141FE43B|nr:2'-5' RNA ligase family protein [Amycolatopsis granulosa]NIH87926.1 2'-5' RNA ligase [Amycolatopsis granulosa]